MSRVGLSVAVQQLYDLVPQCFERPPTWWRAAKDESSQLIGFVLPVLFKEARFWRDGRPQGTIDYMGVLPEYRGRGFALELVHEATRIFVEAVVADATLANNTRKDAPEPGPLALMRKFVACMPEPAP